MRPPVDNVAGPAPTPSAATTGSHRVRPLARTLLEELTMRVTTISIAAIVLCSALGASACMGEIGGERKPKSPGTEEPGGDEPETCSKLEKNVVIRSMADMSTLPETGCYDIYGKLTLQGAQITSLAGLNAINSVNELEIDNTGLTTIDTKRPLGIYGRLVVTGNPRLTGLPQLSFETAPDGILIDGNPVLTSLEPLALDEPRLAQVNGDLAITGNAALTGVALKHLTRVTGALTIAGNAAVRSIDLSKLTSTGHVDLADNPLLTALTGFAATTINGDFAIRNNAQLASLGTMSSLYRVTGGLRIDGNPALTSLGAFTTSIKFIDQALTITNNQNLADLGALKFLQLVGSITITNNRNLVACRADEINRCVPHPGPAVITNNKSASCSSECD